MELPVATAAPMRVAEYIRQHELDRFRLILHGGEPLLAGAERIQEIVTAFRTAIPSDVSLIVAMQTNGSQLTENMLARLPAGLRIGVSFDGDERATALHRLLPSGKSSHQSVLKALEVLRQDPGRYGGILSVVDLRNDPVAIYQTVREQEPPSCDFLLPLATHDKPPLRHSRDEGDGYGRWLADLFDVWYLDTDPRAPVIRIFRLIVERLIGRDVRSGFIGPPPEDRSLVIEPDGSAELLDALRVVGNGAARTGLNILTSSLDEIAAHPGYEQPEPCSDCRACSVFPVCGGGYYPHRFAAANGYGNPSVYCADLLYLINHIRRRLEELADEPAQ